MCAADKSVAAEGKAGEEKGATLAAEVPKDHEVFVNLVDFCRLILPKTQPELFPRWACAYLRACRSPLTARTQISSVAK